MKKLKSILLVTTLFSSGIAYSEGYMDIELGYERVDLFEGNSDEETLDTTDFNGYRGTVGYGYRTRWAQAEAKLGILNGQANHEAQYCDENSNDCKAELQALIAGASLRVGNKYLSAGPAIEVLSSGEKRYLGEVKVGNFKIGNRRDSARLGFKFRYGEQESNTGVKTDYYGASAVLSL